MYILYREICLLEIFNKFIDMHVNGKLWYSPDFRDVRVIIDRCGRHASSLGLFFVRGGGGGGGASSKIQISSDR